jgi:hypothetical protein
MKVLNMALVRNFEVRLEHTLNNSVQSSVILWSVISLETT